MNYWVVDGLNLPFCSMPQHANSVAVCKFGRAHRQDIQDRELGRVVGR